MHAPLSLPLHCSKCGRPVTVEYLPVPDGIPASTPTWTCPHYHCGGNNWLGGIQEVRDVWKGHGPKASSWPTRPPGGDAPTPPDASTNN